MKKKNFLEKHVDPSLFDEQDPLQQAKDIYYYVQNHYTWNERNGTWFNNEVKKAFQAKAGSVSEINITLVNLLKSAGLKAIL